MIFCLPGGTCQVPGGRKIAGLWIAMRISTQADTMKKEFFPNNYVSKYESNADHRKISWNILALNFRLCDLGLGSFSVLIFSFPAYSLSPKETLPNKKI